ncbi:histidine kinase [Streptosporangium sp. NBC_01755]|uniref:histidine kinase n=1 Tax=unclassified Streptosporangium TaxID=2632669 RepID=UPI002DDA3197|nr:MULTISPECIES: histidine kinase [unclassified Streptosporangium]WSA22933.1 histidine kinase [Streptosporangium sp. NBC_01810]WSC98924.1 histidine kinase [Streptosporangium sp. NBC_01755]
MSTTGWVLLCAFSALLGLVLPRPRRRHPDRQGGPTDEATFLTLHIAAMAAPSLRAGLTHESARKAVRHLRALLGTGAVAVADTGGLLAWDGAAGCHRDHAPEHAHEHARTVLASARPHVLTGDEPICDTPGCATRGGIVVPLTVDGRVVGALAAYDPVVSPALVRTVTEVARWVSGQLELAEVDSSRRRTMEEEMRVLRAQMSPHFVYNALTTIASFVRTDPERARELLVEFADFNRYALRRERDFTTLAEELHCVDRYLLLERARFGDRLRFTLRVAPEVLSVSVPFLCLQPLVENAVKHGVAAAGRHGEVRVVVGDAGSEAHISVEDDGPGMPPERVRGLLDGSAPRSGEEGGIGLAGVDVRFRRIYGEDYGLVVESAPNAGTTVRLRVPKLHPANSYL